MRVIAQTFFLLPTVFLAYGCRAPAIPDGPTQIVMHISDREAFLDTTASELRQRDFAIGRIDARQGVLATHPATSQQWFEFWRRDSLGGYQLAESSIHTIRRRVTVTLEEQAPPESDEYAVSVLVEKERFSAPERQVTSSTGALAVFSEHLPTTEGAMAPRSAGAHWVPLGRDPLLEADLLERISGLTPVEAVTPRPLEISEESVSVSEPEPSSTPALKPAPEPKRSSTLIEITDE